MKTLNEKGISMITKKRKLLIVAALCTVGLPASADDAVVRSFVESNLSGILDNPVVRQSIAAQNNAHADLSQADIDALDLEWRAEADGQSGDLIENTLGNSLSEYLGGALEESAGVFTEIFVMDNRGLNVGQSGLTSDYWQGDEAKWQETFLVGSNAIHVSDVEFDESSQTYQLQISVAIQDHDTQTIIGAATFGVNAEALEQVSLEDVY